jgi:hypothetical protein
VRTGDMGMFSSSKLRPEQFLCFLFQLSTKIGMGNLNKGQCPFSLRLSVKVSDPPIPSPCPRQSKRPTRASMPLQSRVAFEGREFRSHPPSVARNGLLSHIMPRRGERHGCEDSRREPPAHPFHHGFPDPLSIVFKYQPKHDPPVQEYSICI